MRKHIFLALILLSFLSACSLPSVGTPAPTQDLVATQVAVQFTQVVTQLTQPPAPTGSLKTLPAVITATPLASTSTPLPPTATVTTTPATTATTTMTSTVAASPTTDSSDPRVKLGAPVWKDNFANGKGWGLDSTYADGETTISVKNNAIVLTSASAIGWVGWRTTTKKPTDFYLEAIIQTKDCATSDQYGLVFRTIEPADFKTSGYWFGVTCDGRYNLRKGNIDGFTDLVKFTASPLIKAGSNQENRLGVWVKGSKISLYANGKLITDLTDTTYPDSDSLGVYIAGVKTINFTIQSTEVAYWAVP